MTQIWTITSKRAHAALRTATAWVACSLIGLANPAFAATFDWGSAETVSPGIKYVRYVASTADGFSPRNNLISCLQIDTTTPNLHFFTTPRMHPWVSGSSETTSQTTCDFVRTSQRSDKKVVVAINGGSWEPFNSSTWNRSMSSDVTGLQISSGILVSPPDGSNPSFVVDKRGFPDFVASVVAGADVSQYQTAITGWIGFCLENGQRASRPANDSLHPRTAIGISKDKRHVYFMTIDGRRNTSIFNSAPISAGVYLNEVGDYLRFFGAYDGLNMDGGGSTTMARWNADTGEAELLNLPTGSGRTYYGAKSWAERATGNNIGVYYRGTTTR